MNTDGIDLVIDLRTEGGGAFMIPTREPSREHAYNEARECILAGGVFCFEATAERPALIVPAAKVISVTIFERSEYERAAREAATRAARQQAGNGAILVPGVRPAH